MVDVRTAEEYRQVNVAGSLLMPVDDMVARHNELPREGALLFICRTGVRSVLANEFAAALGEPPGRLHNVEGGIEGWIADGVKGVER